MRLFVILIFNFVFSYETQFGTTFYNYYVDSIYPDILRTGDEAQGGLKKSFIRVVKIVKN